MNPTRTIAIIGGGFANTTLARALDSRLPPDRELMLISEESYTTYYLSQVPSLGRKVRIFVEWTWGMFFPTDITHLLHTQS